MLKGREGFTLFELLIVIVIVGVLASFAIPLTGVLQTMTQEPELKIAESWQMMGKKDGTISKVAWPSFDEAALKQDQINYAVQINGKVRGQFVAPAGATQEQLKELCLTDINVMRYVEGATIKKFIVVPNKLVSIVV